MKKYTQADFREMPWKNGQGSTTQLLIEPLDADLSNFDWRISCAPIKARGAFSSFRGVDRSLLISAGAGVVLNFNQQVSFTLTNVSPALPFAGEDEVEAELLDAGLLDAEVLDFNVMTRRRLWTHELHRVHFKHQLDVTAKGDLTLVYCALVDELLCSDVKNAELVLKQGELLSSDSAALHLSSTQSATVYIVHLFKAA